VWASPTSDLQDKVGLYGCGPPLQVTYKIKLFHLKAGMAIITLGAITVNYIFKSGISVEFCLLMFLSLRHHSVFLPFPTPLPPFYEWNNFSQMLCPYII